MNNEEQILALLDTIVKGQAATQSDISGLKSDIQNLKETQASMQTDVNARFDKLEAEQEDLKGIMVRFETELNDKVDVLFDSYSHVYDVLKEVRRDVVDLKSDRDIHELHIKHLEGWKKAQ